MSSNEIRLILSGLTCANCANKIETKVNNMNGVKEATLNFTTSTLIIELNGERHDDDIILEAKSIINKLEPGVKVFNKNESNIIPKEVNKCTSDTCSIENKNEKENHTHDKNHSHNNFRGESHEHSSEKPHEHSHEHSHDHSHGHSHDHSNGEAVSLKENMRLIIGAIVYAIALISTEGSILSVVLFALSYVLVGGEVVLTAIKNILRGEVFDENFLMTVATLGAFFVGEFPEGVAVMLFYQIGEVFQSYAVNRSRKSITSLMNIRADYANVLKDGKEEKVNPETVNIDDVIIIKPGERVPLDGIVLDGTSFVDTSALTGESVPREVSTGEDILAGFINTNGVLKVKVTKNFKESTVSRILELVENASNKKAPTEKFITRFARIYTPIVVFSALALAIIPPLVIKDASFYDWIYRALIFLVVSCPCALVVSIPLGLFAGIGGASRKGILVKGGNYLEALKDVNTVVFDKTGTLTKGVFKVTEINNVDIAKEELIKIAAISESLSNHPIAQSIIKEYGKEIDSNELSDYEEISGHGIKVTINNSQVLIGNYKLMEKFKIKYNNINSIGTIVHVAINNEYKGNIVISDEIKEGSKSAIEGLKAIGVSQTVMLTGDNKSVGEKVASLVGVDKVFAELLPGDKVEKVEDLIKNNSTEGKVIFVGDGINDAPVLARADIGVAMGGIGSDAAIEAADVVLMKDDPEALVTAIKVARKTNKILWQNIIFSLGVKVLVLLLGAFGIANMWEAVFADVGVTVIAVINSTRCLK
ncbi:heavy metal translocating P-type ATPase [Clostridium tertium]|uniref:heavy metal translocating P-type ATPase n=1 Tax=Clostridium TaxID=1485 RepID=UPI0011583509|nr:MULTISPECIES: heavy metal translocating P-type ATPase [Clostridium]MDB1921072.1 heavy metal translocating P-type ATPase [Clostridium tertium]MDB1925230.1 heavy metal translocating P-type ATPase [Clostridium tertium]MDB1930316.1 heavy metal translocating P-type ATPase [Clostridium tertium]MDB1933899.1 heavy metal translocating P-type ATPase [Clostridium tertium]MDB1936584.1 heavy metal translocating P-type ATPase [Clostridium tertium]